MTDRPINLPALGVRSIRSGAITQLRRPVGALQLIRPGDRLWIREPFYFDARYDMRSPTHVVDDTRIYHKGPPAIHFAADGPPPAWAGVKRFGRVLPRALHRYHLLVTAIRTEPLQAATVDDARREGHASLNELRMRWDVQQMPSRRIETHNATRWADNPTVLVLLVSFVGSPLGQPVARVVRR